MIAHPFARVLAAALVLLTAGATTSATAVAQKKAKLNRLYKSDDWGYQIRPIKGWNSMPADQEDKYTIGRWKLDTAELEKRGNYEAARAGTYCELSIVRIQPQTLTGEAKEKDRLREDAKANMPKSLRKYIGQPKTIDEWIERKFEGASKRWVRKPIKKGKMKGDWVTFGSGSSNLTIGIFNHMGVEWAVVYRCFEQNRTQWAKIYMKSLQTFKVTKNVDPDTVANRRKDISKLEGEELRAALHDSIKGNPGWYAIDTKHYVFLTNADRKFVTKLSKQLELVRKKVYVPNFKPRNKKIPLNPVRIFRTQREYHQFGGPGGSAGYFSPSKGELVLYQEFENQSASKSEDDCRAVMFHEGFHQYIHFAIGDVSPHSWFNEGHGDFFAGLKIFGSKTKTKLFDWRVKSLKTWLRDADLVPCRTLVRMPQSEYYSNAGLKYSQGWALIYYMREVSKNKAYKKALDVYFNHIADNVAAFKAKKKKDDEEGEDDLSRPNQVRIVNWENREKVEQILSEAVDKAFASIDFEKLDEELKAWIESL